LVIGLSGKAGIGKDTAGAYMKLKYGFERVAFADYLKKIARKLGWNGQKDEKGRRFLQELGQVARQYDANVWVDAAFREIAKLERLGVTTAVITDVRYLNEVQTIKEEGGLAVRIWNEEDESATDLHPSEIELDNYTGWDFKLYSKRGDFNDYYKQIDDILSGRTPKLVGTQTPANSSENIELGY